jgi:hypothetical protein
VLLIAIFVLMLVSIVAIALILSAGTESALTSNYRSSAGVYYAAVAGLEEARGRLLPKNPDYFNKSDALFLPTGGATFPLNWVRYITNPSASDGGVVNPLDPAGPYFDAEYQQDSFPATPITSGTLNVRTLASISGTNAAGIPGPLFKWVRINAVTENSLNIQVDSGNPNDGTTPLYYDYAHVDSHGVLRPSLIVSATPPGSAVQALQITALAVLPNGSKKLLQYLVAPVPVKLPPLLAALTLSGSTGDPAAFHQPNGNSQYAVDGRDHDCLGNLVAAPGAPKVPAIGVFPGTNIAGMKTGIPSGNRPKYMGLNPAPDVEDISALFDPNLQQPSQLDALAQSIIPYRDALVPAGSNSTQISYLTSLGMSATNPLVVVANGDLDITSWSHDGYGLLLVTGTFTYDPDTNWYGIVLVIGKGIVSGDHQQYKVINGAMVVAKTRDAFGALLPDSGGLGGASVVYADSMQGTGVSYSTCSIQKATPPGNFQVLSFHEIPQ